MKHTLTAIPSKLSPYQEHSRNIWTIVPGIRDPALPVPQGRDAI